MVDLSIDLPKGFLDDEPKTLIVPRRRKEVWAVTLDLLVQLDTVCRKHGIRYFCDGGTALGAVRHKGFIPWDDDVDVVMSRNEYEKLNAIAPTEFRHPYFWQTNETDPGSARGHAQLRNSDTTAIMKSEMNSGKPLYRFNQGIFIDVFPFDNLPKDEETKTLFLKTLEKHKNRISRIRFLRVATKFAPDTFPPATRIRHRFQSGLLRFREALRNCDALSDEFLRFENYAQSFNNQGTGLMAPVTFKPHHREVLPSYFFDECEEVEFEFLKIPIFSHWREVLAINYGNWQEHVIGTSVHGGMFVDTSRPYTEYLK